MTARTTGPVRIVGTGLLGASIGQALVQQGVEVVLADASRSALSLAVDYGAGRLAAPQDEPRLVVVAVPPDVTAEVVAAELAAHPTAVVTDVASVKSAILAELRAGGADLSRYVGSHPMAGRERGGAVSARADLFLGRPWVIVEPDAGAGNGAGAAAGDAAATAWHRIEGLALDLRAVPVRMGAREHDEAVALVSHVPQLVSTMLAHRLLGASEEAIGLAGAGLRDTTRIAASDPALWVQILGANAASVVSLLQDYRADLDAAIAALSDPASPGARRAIAELIAAGGAGVARIPGKHGSSKQFRSITVLVDDVPGELARLLTTIGELGINMEDLRLEHSPGVAIGLAEIAVLPEVEQRLATELERLGWRLGAIE